jgi:hypothetical protein
MDLIEKILNKKNGILLYGFTPPKQNNSHEKIAEISEKRIERLKQINIDGLVIYDIQDETSRITDNRPFPFLPTIEPVYYYQNYLNNIEITPIIYQCVGKYSIKEIENKLNKINKVSTVLVGSPSTNEYVKTTLDDAYSKINMQNIPVGGVVIPERHSKKGDEHLRIIKKQQSGCKYFISQCVYDPEKFKNMLSEYYYHCQNNSIEMVPIVMTISPCGSKKTVDLFKWLGVSIPKWIENDLDNSVNTLQTSIDLCTNIVNDVLRFCLDKGIIFGCNVESISISKEEVLASFELVKEIDKLFQRMGLR